MDNLMVVIFIGLIIGTILVQCALVRWIQERIQELRERNK